MESFLVPKSVSWWKLSLTWEDIQGHIYITYSAEMCENWSVLRNRMRNLYKECLYTYPFWKCHSDTLQNAKAGYLALYSERPLTLVCFNFSCYCKRLYSAWYGKFCCRVFCCVVLITIAIRLVNPCFFSYQAVLQIHAYCRIIASWW